MGNVLLVDSATVQAWSAVVIVSLTAALVGTTIMYVRKAGDMVDAMRRSNDLQERNLERILRAEAPSLRRDDGGQTDMTGTEVTGYISLKNTREVASSG